MRKIMNAKYFFACFVVLTIFSGTKTIYSQSKAEKIERLLNRYHEYRLFNGSVLVAEKGKIIFNKGYGYANMEHNVSNKPETKFRIASITKSFVGILILQLVQDGKIDLNATILDYLPDYRNDIGEKITIHHLLTHTSGLPNYTDIPYFWTDSTRIRYKTDDLIKKFCSADLEFEPGTAFNYSNTNYVLLAAIIQKVTEKSFGEVLNEKILGPLNMKNTGVDDNLSILKNRASGYFKTFSGYLREPDFYMPNVIGAGDMYSTVKDCFLLDQALYSDKLLSEKQKNMLFTPFKSNYGYGWRSFYLREIKTRDSLKVISHAGGLNGFYTFVFRLVDDKHFIAIFNNTGEPPLYEIAIGITKILYDDSFDYPQKPISEHLYEIIATDGIDKAKNQYLKLFKAKNNNYSFNMDELRRLGSALIREKRIDEAIEVFQMNAEAYPYNEKVYDDLGEAYMIIKNNDKAIEYFKKSLETNQFNENAYDKLKELGVDIKQKEELIVPLKKLESYIGKYHIIQNVFVSISVEGNKLFGEITDVPKEKLYPESETTFLFKKLSYKIEFIMDEDGNVETLILNDGNSEYNCKKVE